MNTIWAIAAVVIKELYRRKDFYVLFVLTALMTLAAGAVNFFQDLVMVRYVKDLCLFLIWLSTLIIAIVTTARQLPAERESRTIFPLLAKPVSRGQVIAGKFLGCWLASGLAVGCFYLFLFLAMGFKERHWPAGDYLISAGLLWCMLGVVVALTLLGSVLFSAVSANVTICLLAVLGIHLVGEHLNKIALRQPEPLGGIIYAIYFCIPHLEVFDVRAQVVNGLAMPGLGYCLLAALGAAAYAGFLLVLTWAVFRRQRLSV